MTTRRFELHRDTDATGVSGLGIVAEGVHFVEADVVALRFGKEWPTSVVFHERGLASVEKIHGHGGATRIVWLDEAEAEGLREKIKQAEREVVALRQAADLAKAAEEFLLERLALELRTPQEVYEHATKWSLGGWQAVGGLAGLPSAVTTQVANEAWKMLGERAAKAEHQK